MSSRLAQALKLRYEPLAIYYAQEEAPEAKSFKKDQSVKGGWGCAMYLLSQALGGKTVSLSQETCHCPGAAAGMGLTTNYYDKFPGGKTAFCHFLSSGNEAWPEGREVAKKLSEGGAAAEMVEDFLKGEGYKKTPELALDFLERIPHLPPKGKYVILEALQKAWPNIIPEAVIMLADATQISALIYQANYARKGLDNVRVPFSSGCQSIGILPMYEGTQEKPKAILGLTDISARLFIRKILGRELLSFSMPWKLFMEMEDNAEESFLARHSWQKLHSK